ncbi:MAG: 23S rRNA (uracil(1939)-C(5))-methyltransferase RlmD [Bacillota bacterium]|nr:23S rRNA (uracil(1939)-C(5))-methyltransferase RlmD [Bacillota bacterium]MDI7249604.1 23S rRNA (uracil(1939)-C(5))-methyltransferase RlmD [Bacillota bacterium]
MTATAEAKPPVVPGEKIDVLPEGIGEHGEGVARYRGFTVFVDGAIPGDEVLAQIVQVKQNYARARMLEIIRPAPHRVPPRCPVFGRCGGCQLQHMAYAEQLQWKSRFLRDALARIGHLSDVVVRDTLGAAQPWHYRTKVLFPVGRTPGGDGVIVGLYARGTHRIVEVADCPVQHPVNNEILAAARELIVRYGYAPYDEITGTGLVRHLLARTGAATGQAMAGVIVNSRTLPRGREFARDLMRRVPALRSVVLNINTRRTNVILGEETRVLGGQATIEDRVGDFVFRVSARSFFQVNPAQALVLYRQAVAYAALTGEEVVLDAYSGTGTIALFMADRAAKVTGIEEVPEAVADARQNAARNGVANVEFLPGRVEELFKGPRARSLRADVVVLDPPRAGVPAATLEAIARLGPRRVVYVSCNPATLARDLAILHEHGYRTLQVQPVDMFPHTTHVEAVAQVVRARP